MITNSGRDTIARFFAGRIGQIGGSIGLGVGTSPVTLADTSLDYQVSRVAVVAVNPDTSNNRTVFKGRIEPGAIKRIYEIDLYEDRVIAETARTFNLFGEGGGTWSGGVLDPTFARANLNALRVEYAANGTSIAEITGLNENVNNFNNDSQMVAGIHATSGLSSVGVRFGTDADNYFEFLFNDLVQGYNVLKAVRATATITGSPTWESIQYVAVRPSAYDDASGSIHLDGLRIEEQSSGQLVARTVLDVPIDVDTDITSDIEYALRLAFA